MQRAERKEGDPHPLVYGKERAKLFLEMLYQTSLTQSGRLAAGLDDAGNKRLAEGVNSYSASPMGR